MAMNRTLVFVFSVVMFAPHLREITCSAKADDSLSAAGKNIFAKDNLVAWCIVPFDAAKRSPAERAEMVKRLGLTKVAYDWRDEHVPTFEQEILEYKKHGLEFFAFWSHHEEAFKLFEKHGLHPQIWITAPSPANDSQEEKVAAAARQLLPLVERTRKLGSKLGLYNHGGWGGEPANLVAVCEFLRVQHGADHVGIVYNFHHGHDHIADFAESLSQMKPYLLCLNINGMNDNANPKIMTLGEGEHELAMLRTVLASGYSGPIGILDHRPELDTETVLRANLDGLAKLTSQLPAANDSSNFTPRQDPLPVAPPSDAIVLFDGKEVNQFLAIDGGPINWPIVDGALVSTPRNARSNHLVSRVHFRDADIHVEFMLPAEGSGNSGIYIHGHYELQIFNSFGKADPTMDDMGAVYGFAKPLINAGRKPGEWQVYDIRYRAPRRDANGTIVEEGLITAWLNGQKVQENTPVGEPRSKYHPFRYGTTPYLDEIAKVQQTTSIGPVFLQDHDSPVRFRNVWIRPLDDRATTYAP